MTLVHNSVASPVGVLKLVGTDAGLRAVLWPQDSAARVRLGDTVARTDHPLLNRAEQQLREYFAGTRTAFELPLDFAGTAFQKRVWAALLTIPYGQTRSYAQIAAQIGIPQAVRAVGAANGRNPISIIAPCHRVIGSDGSLTGFAGGIANKRFLLALEGRLPSAAANAAAAPQAALF
ncbi:methylated-DNA--[protein]-cysteine S-methyltransferase [Solimonas terrae]|uniref:Methylated-DNA--protein-cysteine methyltransferase n=1 Tax=Solimonas terrae TaxID=1396819 RepID=A0A6M2BUH0_9GAMM|nr:methylated-DNA--[protein]-cysteine S-methyltransferase [Solimonas terrae]